jgi:hypothetical protein
MHCEQKSLTNAYFEELQKSITKEKTMGSAPKPMARWDVLPSKVQGGAPCTLQNAERDLKQRAGLMEVDPHKSTIPMKMPIKAVNKSTYNVWTCTQPLIDCLHIP